MSRTYRQPGLILDHSNRSGNAIAAGDIVVMGDTVGIANVDIADGESGAVSIEGVHEVPKVAGTAWTQGDKLDWDASAGAFAKGATPDAGDVIGCGVAALDAGAADTVGWVKLTPGTGTAQ